jgi:hypothetical protein
MERLPLRFPITLLGFLAAPALLAGQGAVDPSVAYRAAQVALAGDRPRATEMLGHYLATAPDDGSAWLELGRFYLLDSREWHRAGHGGATPGSLFLDFAATALDQSLRIPTDSGLLLRALIEVERAAHQVEVIGWAGVQARGLPVTPGPPAYVAEIGRNLVNSCPLGGVLVTGTDVEAVAVWTVLSGRDRGDLILVLPTRYEDDQAYRARMAEALSVAPAEGLRGALTAAAARRPVCLSPSVDSSAGPHLGLAPARLVRVAGPETAFVTASLSMVDLLEAVQSRPGAVSREVLSLYQAAARYNPLLCASLLAPLGARPRDGCGR